MSERSANTVTVYSRDRALAMKRISERITVPNCITALRIAGTISLLFVQPLSLTFFIIYSLCGMTDVLDGFIARMTKSTSEFGAKLDSIADLLFYTVMILRIFPILWLLLPKWVWGLLAIVLLIRAVSYSFVAIKYHRFASLHTYMNKITGLAVFAIPYIIMCPFAVTYCAAVCLFACIAAIHELCTHMHSKQYTSVKSQESHYEENA